MITKTHKYLVRRCEELSQINNAVEVYPTAMSMLNTVFSGYNIKLIIKHYENLIRSKEYRDSQSNITKDFSEKQCSISHYTTMKLYGLATKPKVSITTEGQSYRLFTFTILHEIGHMLYGDSEIVANKFAEENNKKIWKK